MTACRGVGDNERERETANEGLYEPNRTNQMLETGVRQGKHGVHGKGCREGSHAMSVRVVGKGWKRAFGGGFARAGL